jgi:hypothetical protein
MAQMKFVQVEVLQPAAATPSLIGLDGNGQLWRGNADGTTPTGELNYRWLKIVGPEVEKSTAGVSATFIG